jgi:MFS transporter, DHA1 family, staphyloferrin A biosynthesis exporter
MARPVPPLPVPGSDNSMFSSLKVRDFRYLWSGTLASSFAMNIQFVARGWLVFEMTRSAFMLSWVMLAFALPQVLFALLGGALADRVHKKTLMITAQSFNFVAALVMAYIIFTEKVTFWHFIALGLFNGTVLALSMPSRQSIIPEIVGRSQLMNAISLNSASMNLSRILGPVIGGGLIALFFVEGEIPYHGVGIVYLLIAVLYLTAAVTVSFVDITGKSQRINDNGMLKDIAEGVSYIRNTPVMYGLVIMGTLPMMFGMPLQQLMPAFNSAVLEGGPRDLGLLQTALGVGAIVGTLTLARMGDMGRKGRLLFVGCLMWGAAILLFTLAPSLSVALALGGFASIFSSSLMALNRTMMQLQAPDHLRGRVMSVDQMAHGFMPLGIVPIGLLADHIGVQHGLQVSAGMLVLTTLICLWLLPDVRRIDKGHRGETAAGGSPTEPDGLAARNGTLTPTALQRGAARRD